MIDKIVVTCPNCKAELNAYECVDTQGIDPKDGDVTVCAECGHIAVYELKDEKLTLRDPNAEEILDIAGDPDILAAVELTGMYREWKERNNAKQ